MRRLLSNLWHDDAGFIVSAELVLLGTLLVVGLITGLSCVQEALIGEYQDVAGAIRSLDQSYAYSGMQGCAGPNCCVGSWTAGSTYGIGPAERPVCFDGCLREAGPCTTCPADVPPLPVSEECQPHRIPDCPAHRVETPVPCRDIQVLCEPAAAAIRPESIPLAADCRACEPKAVCGGCERSCGTPAPTATTYSVETSDPSPPLNGPLVW